MDIGKELGKGATWQDLDERINELYHAMIVVEQAGASPELTNVAVELGKRMGYLSEWRDSLLSDQERVEVPPCSVCGLPAVVWKSGGSSAACADHRDGLDAYFR